MPPEDAACSVLTELTNEENAKDATYKANMAHQEQLPSITSAPSGVPQKPVESKTFAG